MSIKSCPRCSNAFDPSKVGGSPYRICPAPGCDMPLDQAAIDGRHPEPVANDPKYVQKMAVRAQAQVDLTELES